MRSSIAVLVALGFALGAGTTTANARGRAMAALTLDDHDIRLTGCLVRGEGDHGGYLLTNGPAEPAWQQSDDAKVVPGAVGTTGGFTTIFYWLDGNEDLERHVGHRVEIEGDLADDLKDGRIAMDRKDHWTELTVKADGRTLKARVPNTSVVAGTGTSGKNDVLVRKVDVDSVKMLDASCGR